MTCSSKEGEVSVIHRDKWGQTKIQLSHSKINCSSSRAYTTACCVYIKNSGAVREALIDSVRSDRTYNMVVAGGW